MKYIAPALCMGIMLVMYSPLDSGKENILELMDEALKETIAIDFYDRNSQEIRARNHSLRKKVKRLTITSKEGSETIELEDSLEEYLADQMAAQYILADIHPIAPDEFNDIFNEELKKRGVSCSTGIVYRHNDKVQYSGRDSLSVKKAIVTLPVTLDIKETVKIQAWAYCDRITLLRHTDKATLGFVILFFIIPAFLFFRKGKKKDTPATHQDITIDSDRNRIYINGKECPTTKTGFLIMSLLAREPECVVTREQIIQTLWPEEKDALDTVLLNNRIDGHINNLRKALCEFPEYRLETVKAKGFQLVRNSQFSSSLGKQWHPFKCF